jgi:hypothetical protein
MILLTRKKKAVSLLFLLIFCQEEALAWSSLASFSSRTRLLPPKQRQRPYHNHCVLSSSTCFASNNKIPENTPLDVVLSDRLPTSVDDQVRQAAQALQRATSDSTIRRHSIRLLLPVIGATELDDWPGGARQMMQAAQPLVERILRQSSSSSTSASSSQLQIQTQSLANDSDGVLVVFAQRLDDDSAKEDCCCVLLPSADTMDALQLLEAQVGPTRNLIVVNPQWKRRSDFASNTINWFGSTSKSESKQQLQWAESLYPTFALTNLMVEGEVIRIIRSYPGPWRVYIRELVDMDYTTTRSAAASAEGINTDDDVTWKQVGTQPFVSTKPLDWEDRTENKRDGWRLYDYNQPSYQDIVQMLQACEDYVVKNPAERAKAAFDFIKDTL